MKTGIVTVYDPLNYGNRLQNYAMHKILTGLGCECETLIPRPQKKTQNRNRKENAVRKLYSADPVRSQKNYPVITKQLRFEEFEKCYLPVKKVNEIIFHAALANEYDWIVTGGEYIWNPWHLNNVGKLDNQLLAFAHSRKRLCMAPAIAAEEIPEHLQNQYHTQWIRFPWLNVRFPEDAARIREITGRDAELMLDPVLMIDAHHWMGLMKPLPDFDEQDPYCLVWFLEEKGNTPEMEKRFLELLPGEACRLCYLDRQGDVAGLTAGPSEFLYLINHSQAVVTDTYYGVVFAVIFGKPFVFSASGKTYVPEHYTVRKQIEALLNLLHVPYHTSDHFLWSSHITWQESDIAQEREQSIHLLKKMLCADKLESEKEVRCQ